jgi:hypothetical protein
MNSDIFPNHDVGVTIDVVDLDETGDGLITINFYAPSGRHTVYLSSAMALDITGRLANVFAARDHDRERNAIAPIEATYTATTEGKAAVERICTFCNCDAAKESIDGIRDRCEFHWNHLDTDDCSRCEVEREIDARTVLVPGATIDQNNARFAAEFTAVADIDTTPALPFAVGDWVSAPASRYEVRVDGPLEPRALGWGKFVSLSFRDKSSRNNTYRQHNTEMHQLDPSSEWHFTKVSDDVEVR